MNSKILFNKEKLTEAFSRRMQAYALLLDSRHQKVETALTNMVQTTNVTGINKTIAQYEIADTAHMGSSVEVEQGSEEAFSQRMQSYVLALNAIKRPNITCYELVSG